MNVRTKIQLALLDNLVWVILFAFFLINAIFTPMFFTSRNLLNILFQTSILGLLVLAQGIVMMVGELDLSLDASLAFAPGIIVLTTTMVDIAPAVSILLTLALGAAIGLFNGFFVARTKANSFLFTLSTQIIMRGLVLFWVPFSIAGLNEVYAFLGRGRIGNIQAATIAFIAIFLIFELIFRKTIFGRKFKLTGGNRQAAYISGINTDRVIILAFIVAGMLAAVAGLITAGRQNAVSNTMGMGMVTMAIAGAILGGCNFKGGIGKPIGMLGGALLLGMIDNALTLLGVSVNLVNATKGGLILVAILLDHWRFRANVGILHKVNIKKLTESHAAPTGHSDHAG
jgi:simple sugar transport system permease protein/ribose transport system permease protein